MKIYFVRHGSTDSLEKKISQPNNEPLNERGINQAKELKKRFANVQIDLVLSSSHLRAAQTAKEISDDFQTSSLFVEIKRPKEVIGQSSEREEIKSIYKKVEEMYLVDPHWHYSDEENFEDLKIRGLKALEYLQNLNYENVVVVSHGHFIVLLIGLMMFNKDCPAELLIKLKPFFRLSNTGVTICNFNEGRWTLECWNDTSHCLE